MKWEVNCTEIGFSKGIAKTFEVKSSILEFSKYGGHDLSSSINNIMVNEEGQITWA